MRQIRHLAAIAALCMALAGCFVSEAPLIGPEDAVFPVERLTFRSVEGDGEVQTLAREGDAYRFTAGDESDAFAFVRLREVGENQYVAALWAPPEIDEKVPVLYAFLVADVAGRRVGSYAAVKPDDFAPLPGLELCEREVCIEDLDAYVAYARHRIAAGVPPDATYEILAVE